MKGLARLSGLSVGLKLVRFVLGIGASALLTRVMSVHDYGVYAYALVIALLLAIPGEAGMPNLVMREITRARVDGDLPLVRGMVVFANLTVLILTLAMAAIAVLVLWALGDHVSAMLRWALAAAFPALLFGALANTRAGVQRALGSLIASQVPEQVVRPAGVILFTLILWRLVGGPLDPVQSLIGYTLASIAAFSVGAAMLFHSYRAVVGPGPARFRTRPWLSALAPFSAIAGLQVALVYISAFTLGFLAPPSEVAAFRIATVASDTVLFAMFAINTVIAPQFAEHFHRGETAELQLLVARANRLNLAFAALVTLGLVAIGPWGLAFAFGEAYRVAYFPMCIVAIGHLAGLTMGYATTLANMAGRERLTLAAAGFGLALNTVLSLLLCARYGALGAAIATAVTAILWRLALSVRLLRVSGIRTWAIGTQSRA